MIREERKEQFLKALNAGYGIILTACEAVNISRNTYYKWKREDDEFRQRVEEIQESQIDFVESKLINAINANDTTAIIFYLKTKGKKRGYTEKILPAANTLPVAGDNALPDQSSKEKEKRLIERKVKSKKAYIVKLLKSQGKYTTELTYQVDITAKLLVRADIIGDEIISGGHKAVNVEYSREGNERVTLNPKEKLYIDLLEKGQRALRALGMNTESKERKTDSDGYTDFLELTRPEED